jgi:hypothetical protein
LVCRRQLGVFYGAAKKIKTMQKYIDMIVDLQEECILKSQWGLCDTVANILNAMRAEFETLHAIKEDYEPPLEQTCHTVFVRRPAAGGQKQYWLVSFGGEFQAQESLLAYKSLALVDAAGDVPDMVEIAYKASSYEDALDFISRRS